MSEYSPLLHLSHPRIGPLFQSPKYIDTKDPCPVFDGVTWHLYGSGGSSAIERWHIFHVTASKPEGPWNVAEAAILQGITGGGIAAPSVTFDPDQKIFHMFVQTHYSELGSTLEHLTSADGSYFKYHDTVLTSIPLSPEAGIYDPHTAVINGEKYISYSGFPIVSRPDIYLAKSMTNTWDGPWIRMGRILSHFEISHHNQHDNVHYEWGLEGSQLIELPHGLILMNAVCFLPHGERGTRQRVFFSIARKPEGPYLTLGQALNPIDNEWESGENGHAAGVIINEELLLFYQARSREKGKDTWKCGLTRFNTEIIEKIGEERLKDFEAKNALMPTHELLS